MNNNLICCHWCGTMSNYDEHTIYLKCPNCNTVLIDSKIDREEADPLIVVDYGIDHLEDGDWMWVEVEDQCGNKYTYWKRKDIYENFQKSC